MIIVRIIGGLGNQMFQYATGRALAQKYGVDLKLDITGFEEYKLHRYALDNLSINEKISTPKELLAFTSKGNKALSRWIPGIVKNKFVRESGFAFDPSIFLIGKSVYLDGYWQSEKYFSDIESIIRSEFTVSKNPDVENAKLMEEISGVNAVSIHVRRGDYVANEKTMMIHGVCGLDYYDRAIKHISGSVANPTFFVFSDDPQWVQDNLKIPFPTTYVTHNGPGKNYEDLRLMSLCKHNIIANSSFSWWGAWLNNNPDKAVIAPGKWFNDESKDTKDLIPEGWVKV